MTARRQSSTTSLAKYARVNSPDLANRSFDFCNAFWGLGDGGVDVLFARMRGASRTMEELKNYWKERSSIEEDYAKRLSKLAKMTLGKDEIGELRNSLDTLRLETDKQAGFHHQLAHQIRTDLDGQTTTFHSKQIHHKKAYQAAIEKEFKERQTQESYVNKARQKYESDCLRINSYTAQSTLVQGKELEKLHLKLERAQQTVQANERDYAQFAKAYTDTTQKWEQDWKAFCDSCQDLEEDRLEFMKDNLWAYANAVSTVCVSDDESCEKMRLALEQMEPERDMENFVRDYGTGNAIPDPPTFVNYSAPDAVPSSSSRPTTRPAQFARSTQRHGPRAAPPEPDEPFVNTAGVGAGGSRKDSLPESNLHRSGTVGSSRGRQVNGAGSVNGQNIQRRPTVSSQQQSSYRPPQDPQAEPIDPTADTYIKVGSNAYKVDLSKDPQQGGSGSSSASGRGAAAAAAAQNGGDPLAKQMEALKHAATGSVRRNSTYKNRPGTADTSAATGSLVLSPPAGSSSNAGGSSQGQRDYRNSAEVVVGAYPGSSRPSSPAPTASFMVPPSQRPVSPAMKDVPVEDVVADYHRPLPGERRKSISRPNSRNSPHAPGQGAGPSSSVPNHDHSHSHSRNQSHSQGANLERPLSRTGHPGIGAHGGSRSNSPVGGYKAPQPSGQPAGGAGFNRAGSGRAHSPNPNPNPVGVALGPDGRVIMDTMADRYRQQQPPPTNQYNAPNQTPGPHRRQSYLGGPPTQPPYGVAPPPPPGPTYQRPPQQQQPSYIQQQIPPPQQPYNPPPQSQPYPAAHQPQQPVYQQPPQGRGANYGPNGAGVVNQSYAGYNSGSAGRQQQMPPQNDYYRGPSPAPPSPQPPPQQHQGPPTGQTTEDGRGILFYVKALYDYSATIEEEFDFQSGDIIAVTATPEDGWWSGELLDEARRQPGRHVFPSNFVCLF